MRIQAITQGLRTAAFAAVAAIAVSAPAHAYGHGGGGFAVGHGGVAHGGVAHGGYGHGGYGYGHGGYGYGHGYGYRGGYWGHYGYGWRGGWGWGGCWGCGWWGWPGYGLFLATLPLYYTTLWWDGVPYYYADNNYYVWNNEANGYVSVSPPAGLVSSSEPRMLSPEGTTEGAPPPAAGSPAGVPELFAYPKNGQTAEQQARDRQECGSWAATQSGATNRIENLRAQSACLEARGYSVR